MENLSRSEVFRPNSYPKYTYIEQDGKDLESRLLEAIEVPGGVISLAGPSKSGKTVLIKNVIDEEYLVRVLGSEISSVSDLWRRILEDMGSAHSVEESSQNIAEKGISTRLMAKLGLNQLVGGEGEVQTDVRQSNTYGENKIHI